MKKFLAFLLAVTMVFAMAACGSSKTAETTAAATEAAVEATLSEAEATASPTGAAEAEADVMTHADYEAAELNDAVIVETYVQAHQSWWDNKVTIYCQSEDGAYFVYNAECTEEDAARLETGTKIRVMGYKTEWSGEVEIADATIEFLDGSFVAEPEDVTALLGTDELAGHQNEKVALKNLVVTASNDEGAAFLYNWDGSGAEGNNNDLYFNVTDGINTYTFTVESYLCGEGSDVYTAVTELNVGDVIDLEGFLYWYNGAQPHITAVTECDSPSVILKDGAVYGEGANSFTFTVKDADENTVTVTVNTDAATVGEALVALNMIAGDDSDYGLYVKSVNGITADYDADGAYWAFYIDGEYAMTGVDSTDVTADAVYSFEYTKG